MFAGCMCKDGGGTVVWVAPRVNQMITIRFIENVFTHRRMYSRASVCLTTAERRHGATQGAGTRVGLLLYPRLPRWRETLVTLELEFVGRRSEAGQGKL